MDTHQTRYKKKQAMEGEELDNGDSTKIKKKLKEEKTKSINKQGPGRPRKNVITNQSSLIDIIINGRASYQGVVDEWIEEYKKDKIAAIRILMQLFIDASGCKGKITPEIQNTMEHSEIIRKMTEQFDEDNADYPLVAGGIHKRFRTNFADFIQTLIKQCQFSIIFDPYIIDNILHFLIGLADSQVRAFRHTSTFAALKIMTALVDVIINISTNLDYSVRQYETEKGKCTSKRPSERLEMLAQKKQEIEENNNDVCTQLTYIFRSIFVHRYRDIVPDIRALCMFELGIWMKRYPKLFLDDSYLKYIGWTLYDKVGEVRLKCLMALQPLYSSEESATKLELFTNKFKDRIVAMTLDKDYDVAVQAVKLINYILKYHKDILTDRDCEHVYELVYSIHKQVAQAAGEFLKERLFTLDEDALNKVVKTKRGKKRLPNTPLIRDLVQFFIESELHEHAAYLVDSLIETNEMMKDWECMTDLLLEEPGRGEEALDNLQETSLIEIMTCCIKQASTGDSPVARSVTRKTHASTKENKQLMEERSKITQHFMVNLPVLIAKYIADPEKIGNLLLIPQYFDLDLYVLNRCEKHLEALLKYMEDIVCKHLNPDVLSTCAKTYECLCLNDGTVGQYCKTSRSTLIDILIERVKTTFEDFALQKKQPDDDQNFALLSSLKRLAAFIEFHDMSNCEIWDVLLSIMKMGCDLTLNYNVDPDILDKALSAAHFFLIWNLHSIIEQVTNLNYNNNTAVTINIANQKETMSGTENISIATNNENVAIDVVNSSCQTTTVLLEQMNVLRARLAEYTTCAQELMYVGGFLEEDAYLSICDLLIYFNRHIPYSNSLLKNVVFEPDKNTITQLNNFVMEKVFVNSQQNDEENNGQTKIEQLRKGRNFLASFCKLIIYNVIGIHNAVDIFRNYTKFYIDYGDIIKLTLAKAREINKVSCAKVIITALQCQYKDIIKACQKEFLESGTTHKDTAIKQQQNKIPLDVLIHSTAWLEGFSALKELGRRFCLSFGLDQIKIREAIALIHKDGIIFAFASGDQTSNGPPINIYFLDIVSEFSNKLMKQDKRTVLNFLDRHLPAGGLTSCKEDWQPLHNYRNGLSQHLDNTSIVLNNISQALEDATIKTKEPNVMNPSPKRAHKITEQDNQWLISNIQSSSLQNPQEAYHNTSNQSYTAQHIAAFENNQIYNQAANMVLNESHIEKSNAIEDQLNLNNMIPNDFYRNEMLDNLTSFVYNANLSSNIRQDL